MPETTRKAILAEDDYSEEPTKLYPRKCRWCGKEFMPINKSNVYCNHKCSRKWHSAKNRGEKPPSSVDKKGLSISGIAKKAKAAGLSYGIYVGRQND